MMKSSRKPQDYPDRQLECEEALETDIIVLFDDVTSAGWSVAETALAISSLVENYMMGQSENAQTEFTILKARIEHADELPLQDP